MTESPSSVSALDRLEAGVADLHVPEPNADAERLLMKLGVGLPVIGVVLIIIGWWNASGTAFVADQIPMLLSGGILGMGLITVGLGLFVRFSLARLLRFWMARLVVEQQAQTDRMIDALERIEAAVRDATSDAPVVVEVNEHAKS